MKEYRIINFNYSKTDEGELEEKILGSLFPAHYSTPTHLESPKDKLKRKGYSLSKEINSPTLNQADYSKVCQNMMDFCDELIGLQTDKYTLQMLMLLRLKARVRLLKKKSDQKQCNFLEPYEIKNGIYNDVNFFAREEVEVLKEMYPVALELLKEKLDQTVDGSCLKPDIDALGWVVKRFVYSDISSLCIEVFLKLISQFIYTGSDFYVPLLSCFRENLSTLFAENLANRILVDQKFIKQIQYHNQVSFLLDVLKEIVPTFPEILINNVSGLNFITKSYPSGNPRMFSLLYNLSLKSTGFFRRVLQAGFEYQVFAAIFLTLFNEYRNTLTEILYEALARGDLSTAEKLLNLTNKHENKTEITKEKISEKTNTETTSAAKIVVKKSNIYTKYEDGLILDMDKFLAYLEEKYQRENPNLATTSPGFFARPAGATKQSSLFFINQPNSMIAILTKLGIIPEDAVEEAKAIFSKRFGVSFAPEPSKLPIAPEVRTIVEAQQKQIEDLMVFVNLQQEQIKALQGEVRELRGKVEALSPEVARCSLK